MTRPCTPQNPSSPAATSVAAPVSYSLTGCVNDPNTGLGVAGLRVQWSKAIVSPGAEVTLAFSVATNSEGNFAFGLTPKNVDDLLGDAESAQIELHVFRNIAELITETITVTRDRLQNGPKYELTIPYVVTGRVLLPNGMPRDPETNAPVVVQAVSKTLRRETVLGQATADSEGNYSVAYGTAGDRDPTKANVDLVMVARDLSTGEEIGRSDVWSGPPGSAPIDVLIGEDEFLGRTLLEVYVDSITPYLDGEVIENLNGDDVAFLATKRELDPVTLALVVRAYALQVENDTIWRGANADAPSPIGVEAFFAFVMSDLPQDLASLARAAESDQRNALESANTANLVQTWAAGEVDTILANLKLLAGYVEFAAPSPFMLQELVQAAGLGVAVAQDLYTFRQSYQGSDFWTDFGATQSPVLPAGDQARLAFVFELAPLVSNYLPLIQILVGEFDGGATLADMARYDTTAWAAFMTDVAHGPIGAPTWVVGDDDAERRSNFSAQIALRFENAYPTAASARVAVTANNDQATTFLSQNANFDLATSVIGEVGSGTWTIPAGPLNEADLLADLKLRQRLQSVAPTNEKSAVAATLANDATLPIRSAQQISQMGRARFVSHFSGALGEATANQVFNQADQASSAIAVLAMAYQDSLGADTETRDSSAFPEMASLLGPLGYCASRHCRSVFGPAAYLADVLQWLGEHSLSSNNALTALRTRRPDIVKVHLNCVNTNTVMPQIDLVNELLEARVVGGVDPGDRQTTWDAEDLRAHPEHLNATAYSALAGGGPNGNGYYPWGLPWNLRWAEVQEYLQAVGVRRADLMEQAAWSPGASQLRATHYERIGLGPTQAPIVFDVANSYGAQLHLPWGMSAGSHEVQLRNVETLMARSGLSFTDIEEILDTVYFQERDRDTPFVVSYVEPCSLVGAELTDEQPTVGYPDAAAFDRIHRFTRLRRALGWTVREVDMAVSTLSFDTDGIADADIVPELASLVQLRERFANTAFEDLLAWGGSLWAWRYQDDLPSFYERLFYNPTVEGTATVLAATGLVAFAPNELGTGLPNGDVAYTPVVHQVALLGGLGVSSEDVERLTSADNVGTTGPMGSFTINLSNLSALRRYATLSRALDISIEELLVLRDVANVLPFGSVPSDPTLTGVLPFVRIVDEMMASGLSAREFGYVFKHRYAEDPEVGFADRAQMTFVVELARGTKKITEDAAAAAGREETALGQLPAILTRLIDPEDVESLMAVVNKVSPFPDNPTHDAFFAALDTDHGIDLVTPGIAATLAGTAGSEEVRAQSVLDVVGPLAPILRRRELVVDLVATTFGLTNAVAASVLDGLAVATPAPPGVVTLADLFQDPLLTDASVIDLEEHAQEIATDGFKAAYLGRLDTAAGNGDHSAALIDAFHRLRKIQILVEGHKLAPATVAWMLDTSNDAANVFLDLRQLDSDGSGNLFAAWRNLARFAKLRDTLFPNAETLLSLLTQARAAGTTESLSASDPAIVDLRQSLSDATGWSLERVVDLASAYPLTVDAVTIDASGPQNDVFGIGTSVFGFEDATGAGPAMLAEWATSNPTDAQAAQVKVAVKSQFSAERWPSLIEPTRNRLRERQRDALVDWIVVDDGHEDADALFKELLIDTQVSACAKTSRIRQAMSSVQTFVQRVALNLESPVVLNEEATDTWRTMSRYRVWEAGRKVFLYPENWVMPELRRDKSELFDQLESDLLSEELSEESVEKAYTRYLESLDEISRLETASVLWQEERDDFGEVAGRHLHVIGVRPGSPNRHFYRRWVDESYWTAWEEIPFQIDSRDVLLVEHDRRLWLFWAKLAEKAVEPESTSDKRKPEKYHEFRLAYSRLTADGWSPARETEGYFTDRHVDPKHRFSRRDGNPVLEAYVTKEAEDLVIELSWPVSFKVTREPDTIPIPIPGLPNLTSIEVPAPTQGGAAAIDDIAGSQDTINRFTLVRGGFRQSRCADAFVRVNPRAQGLPIEYRRPGRSNLVLYRRTGPYPIDTTPHGQAFATKDGLPQSEFRVNLLYYNASADGERRTGNVIRTAGEYRLYASRHADYLCETPSVVQDWLRRFVLEPERSLGTGGGAPPAAVVDQAAGIPSGAGEAFPGQAGDPAPVSTLASPVYEPVGLSLVGTRGYLSASASAASGITNQNPSPAAPPSMARVSTPEPTSWPGAFRLHLAYHPFTCKMLAAVRRDGIEGLFRARAGTGLDRQRASVDIFTSEYYDPSSVVREPYPVETYDFTPGGAYSLYNWEIFFHAPMLIVERLISEQRFEDAQRWLHFIFDPTTTRQEPAGSPDSRRYWNIKPFNLSDNGIPDSVLDGLKALASGGGPTAAGRSLAARMDRQVERWRLDPFDPHLVAGLRPGAYQRYVLMKYLDLLIEWGDSLFRQDTLESVNEAFQIYLLASNLLGDRPQELPEQNTGTTTFEDLESGGVDSFGNEVVEFENTYRPQHRTGARGSRNRNRFSGFSLRFSVPPNAKFLGYWDTVHDRLFKIRNCLNIEGVRRNLALFDPPIDPALLVRAAAAGIDVSSALRGLFAPLPHYRFRSMLRLARDVTQEVKSLGQSLLSTLEKKDSELLAQLRSTHEINLVSSQRAALENSVNEARETRKSLDRSAAVVEDRKAHYEDLRKTGKIGQEIHQLEKLRNSNTINKVTAAFQTVAATGAWIPVADAGISGLGPHLSAMWGGPNLHSAASGIASSLQAFSTIASTKASISGTKGGFIRRSEDWDLQITQAEKELERIEQDKIAADIRIAIAERRLKEHDVQRDNAEEAGAFLHEKYTNEELYMWMERELKRVHYQAYELAVELSRRAERTYQHELADQQSTFIQSSHYDKQRKGLLAGEMLMQDLQRMEAAYHENNKREFELTTQISIGDLDPVALLTLKETGSAHFSLPEVLFDLEQPGMYMRRIKSVRVTIPAVTGPYTNVSCKLTLARSEVRRKPVTGTDDVVVDRLTSSHSIVTSSAQNDAGLFNENFEDERYLPFEGKGVVSDWLIELPEPVRQFDYESISDVVLTISYTARYDGAYGSTVSGALLTALNDAGLSQGFSAQQDFPDALAQVQSATGTDASLTMDFTEPRFPGRPRPGNVRIQSVLAILVYGGSVPSSADVEILAEGEDPVTDPGSETAVSAGSGTILSGTSLEATRSFTDADPGAWRMDLPASLVTADLQDILFIVEYTVS